jgi:C-terminal processing protease CtpA/Prc
MLLVGGVMLRSSVLGLSLELPTKTLVDLSSSEFHKREAAQSELLVWSRRQHEPAMEELFSQSQAAVDPEVRQRCLNVLRELVMDEYSKEGEGFIGIAMKDEISDVPNDPKARKVIRVTEVRQNTPARRAGILMNDLIVGFDGEVWYDKDALLPFREKIRAMKPNTKIVLKIIRDGKVLDCNVTLARRPLLADMPFFNGQNFDPDADERAAKEAYFRRWLSQKKLQK